jgi:ribonuclease E
MKHEPIKKEMLINVLQPEECRIAIVENGVLEELYVERTSQESYVGNIYKGRIVNIEPSIQAAFVDFGVGRNGFLHVSDVDPVYYRNKAQRRSDDLQDVLNLQEFEVPDLPEEEFSDEETVEDAEDDFEDRLPEDAAESDEVLSEVDLAPESAEPLESDYPSYEDDLGMEVDYEGQPPQPEERPPRRGRGRGRGRGRRGPRRGSTGPRAGGRDLTARRQPPRASRGSIGYFGRDPEDYRRFGANIEGLEPVPPPEPPSSSAPPSPAETSVRQTTPSDAEVSPLPADLTSDFTETSHSEPVPETSPPPAKARQRRPRYSSLPIPPADAVLNMGGPSLPLSAERSSRTSRRQPERSSSSTDAPENSLEADGEEQSSPDEAETMHLSSDRSLEGTNTDYLESDLDADDVAAPVEDVTTPMVRGKRGMGFLCC